jgi:hypothetical protein
MTFAMTDHSYIDFNAMSLEKQKIAEDLLLSLDYSIPTEFITDFMSANPIYSMPDRKSGEQIKQYKFELKTEDKDQSMTIIANTHNKRVTISFTDRKCTPHKRRDFPMNTELQRARSIKKITELSV